MINFEEGKIPEKKLVTLTAYISEVELLFHGKNFANHVIKDLINRSIMLKQAELMFIVDEILMSQETRNYIQTSIREAIKEHIGKEVDNMFDRDKV